MVTGLIWLIVVIAILVVFWWFIRQVPDDKFPPIIKSALIAIFAIVCLVVIVKMLIGLVGAPPGF